MVLRGLTLLVSSFLFAVFAMASAGEGNHEHEEKPFNVNEMIMHHIKDAHEYHLWGGHDGTTIYLPIILVDGGMKVFSSSHFYHGEMKEVVDSTGEALHYLAGVGPAEGYAMFHEKIYKMTDGELHFEGGHPHADKPLDMSITRNVIALFITSFVILLIMLSTAAFYKKNGAVAPKGIAKFVEPIIVFVRDDIAKANIDHHKYKRYVPFLLTIFFFIWISNLLGLIPLLGSNLTGNISVTLFLATCTLLVTVFSGNKNYWKHIFATPGVPVALLPIMIPIEIVGVFTKPFALMVRLFANITAGHIIILALVSIIFINKSAAWGALSVPMALFISVLELLVAFLQAYLFAMLSALFIGAAVEEAHH
jgi:F-type H+-transporting ATPase subunit a